MSANTQHTNPTISRIGASALLFVGALLGAMVFAVATGYRYEPTMRQGLLSTNQSFIESYPYQPDLTDVMDVFRYIFMRLDDVVIVYPTENHYYFRFPASKGTVWGSLGLYTIDRDQGVLTFGYVLRPEVMEAKLSSPEGMAKDLTQSDGVLVEKISDFSYSVTFEDKRVLFKLNDIGLKPPLKAKLREDEIWVGPSYDESALRFFLVFNVAVSRLYWILNEDEVVSESFRYHSDQVFIGERTGFVFYDDATNNRKILIGVRAVDVLNNTWFDGPFDQMPDNYVYTGAIQTAAFIEKAYPAVRGKIDEYGYYKNLTGMRVPIANYRVYYDEDELNFVSICNKDNSLDAPEFYDCITRQIFHATPP